MTSTPGRFVDLLEVDAASRTKVDDTRELLDNVQYSPARGRYKVYLIDEVHMLSAHSFNALLKTLEEPPPHVKFLLATTDPQKLPVTVLSRCLQFNLRRLPPQQILERLAQISRGREGRVRARRACVRSRARAEGSMRDALSLLDQVLAFGGGRALEAEARSLLGTLDRRHVESILTALAAARRIGALMRSRRELDERAPDYHQALGELAGALQRMALLQALPDLPTRRRRRGRRAARALAAQFAPEDLQLCYQIAITSRRDLDYAPDARAGFEMALLRMLAFRPASTRRTTSPRPAGSARDTAHVRAPPASPSPANSGAAVAARGREVARRNGTGDCLRGCDLQGPVRQLAAHCVLTSRSGDVLRLRLDRSGEMFRRPQLEQKLAQALSDALQVDPLRLEISVSDVGGGHAGAPRRRRLPTNGCARPRKRSRATRPCARCARFSARRCSRAPSSRSTDDQPRGEAQR